MPEPVVIRLTLPAGPARDAVASALVEQGFAVQPTATGSLDVSRGSLGTTLIAGAFAGQDIHVRFDVHVRDEPGGAVVEFVHSAAGGFFKGGAVGAAKAGDVVREAAHLAGARLASQGAIVGGFAGESSSPAPAPANGATVPPAPGAADAGPPAPAPADAHPTATTAGAPAWSAPSVPHSGALDVPAAPAPPFAGAPVATPSGYPGYPGAAPSGSPSTSTPYGDGTTPYAPGATPYGDGSTPYGYGATPYAAGAASAASERTNGVAIAAIIMGFVLPLGGIIAGAVALAQIKRTGEKGRGLAIGGIVAGGIIMVLSIVAIVAFVLFALIGAGAASSSSDPFDLPAEPDGGSVTIGPGDQAPSDAYTLPVGACLDDVPSGVISPANLVDCAQPHSYEVFGSFFLSDGAFPGDDAIESSAYEGCDAAYPDYVGIPWQQSTLEYYYVSPTEQTWAEGDREISCLLYDPDADQTTGSLRGSAR